MTYSLPTGIAPFETPKALKWLMGLIIGISLSVGIVDSIFMHASGDFPLAPNYLRLEWILGLSQSGIDSFYIWQPFTYLFLQHVPSYGLTFGFLFYLALNVYILWILGAQIVERLGTAALLWIFLGIGSAVGLITIQFMPYNLPLVGPNASLMALFTIWTMLGPDFEVLLFFVFPVKARRLLAALLIGVMLISIAQMEISSLILTLASFMLAYFIGTMVWHLPGPFLWMRKIDQLNYKLSHRVEKLLFHDEHETKSRHKIFDIRTGQPVLDDDEFIDAMLNKISLHGEEALSWLEKKRMNEISEKRRKTQ